MATTRELMAEICASLGLPMVEPRRGATEPAEFYVALAERLGVPIADTTGRRLSKTRLARDIVESAGLGWRPEWDGTLTPSRGGGSVTNEGLSQLLEAARMLDAELRSVPILAPVPDTNAPVDVPAPAGVSDTRDGDRSTLEQAARWRIGAQDAANRELGAKGEEWVCQLERAELLRLGQAGLSERVEWVAMTRGDGLGYDVLSFAADGSERWLEVKTTNAGIHTPFFLTPNELATWRQHTDRYEVHRVFRFSTAPRRYRLVGEPDTVADLSVATWLARPR